MPSEKVEPSDFESLPQTKPQTTEPGPETALGTTQRSPLSLQVKKEPEVTEDPDEDRQGRQGPRPNWMDLGAGPGCPEATGPLPPASSCQDPLQSSLSVASMLSPGMRRAAGVSTCGRHAGFPPQDPLRDVSWSLGKATAGWGYGWVQMREDPKVLGADPPLHTSRADATAGHPLHHSCGPLCNAPSHQHCLYAQISCRRAGKT